MKFACAILPALLLGACATTARHAHVAQASPSCGDGMIGLFDPTRDLLIANYDGKPDVDDLQAVAALGSVLKHPRYSCVDYVATAGAYGKQGGDYIAAPRLFDLAFGKGRWLDAHGARDATVAELARRARETIAKGGKVWVAEAGQSDVTAAFVRQMPETMWTKVNVVQHSYWNETQGGDEAMQTVVYNTRYHRVPDGNFPDNGSPAFNTKDSRFWPALLADPVVGPVWTEAKRLSDLHNPKAAYVNPAVAAGGMDFSDAVEVAYVFGFVDMVGVGNFVDRILIRD